MEVVGASPDSDEGQLAEPALLVLDSLADGPKHGYALMVDIEARTRRAIGPGTLYAALARLERRGHIRALPPVERRRPYELTDAGARFLEAQLRRLAAFSRSGLRRLAERGP
jgi:DNA-binding PadR family transcriptional regulator